jgi:hypothetical protein
LRGWRGGAFRNAVISYPVSPILIGPGLTGADRLCRRSLHRYGRLGAGAGGGARPGSEPGFVAAGGVICVAADGESLDATRVGSWATPKPIASTITRTRLRLSIPIRCCCGDRTVRSRDCRTSGRLDRDSRTWLTSLRLSHDNLPQLGQFLFPPAQANSRSEGTAWPKCRCPPMSSAHKRFGAHAHFAVPRY